MIDPKNLRDYSNDARLEKVFLHLKRTPLRSRRNASLTSSASFLRAAALVVFGIASGITYERLQTREQSLVLVRAEQRGVSAAGQSLAQRPTDRPQSGSKREEQTANNSPDIGSVTTQTLEKNRSRKQLIDRRNHADSNLKPSAEMNLEQAGSERDNLTPQEEVELSAVRLAPWRLLSEQGQFAEALSELEASGGFDRAFVSASSEELMLLADIARFAGRRGRAIQALRQLTNTFFLSPQAPMAALTLGHLLSAANDLRGAADAYSLNRRLSPGGEFAEDALIREFSLAIEGARLARAQALFTQYTQEFPEGRQQDSLRDELGRLEQLKLDAAPDGSLLQPTEKEQEAELSEGNYEPSQKEAKAAAEEASAEAEEPLEGSSSEDDDSSDDDSSDEAPIIAGSEADMPADDTPEVVENADAASNDETNAASGGKAAREPSSTP